MVFITLSANKLQAKRSSGCSYNEDHFSGLKWRNIGPFRGGRSVAASGISGNSQIYYFGSVGGGLWKTTDAGLNWKNISDGFFKSGSVGAKGRDALEAINNWEKQRIIQSEFGEFNSYMPKATIRP